MKILYTISILILIFSCNSDQKNESDRLEYKRWVGDITFDASKDSEEFLLCNDESQAYQYFNDSNGLQYEGEKIAIINTFESEYQVSNKNESGLIRVRFIVNCKGETGRFRILGMDNNFNQKKFNQKTTDELLRITKTLKKWKPKTINGQAADYYQYLVFRLKEGEITEILP
jgi:hypothetical protein